MVVVILAGGLATRLRPLTEKIPKSLVLVGGRTFIDYQLELLARSGVTDVLLCIGVYGDQIRAHCGDGSRYGLRITYSDDGPEPRGTGGALLHARALLPERFFIMYGDSYLLCPYRDIWETFTRATSQGLMTVYENRNAYDRSNVVVEGGRVVVYDKIGVTSNMRYIDYGLSLFRQEVFQFAPPEAAFDLAALHRMLIARGELLAYEVPTRFYEIGSPAGLQEFDELVRKGAVVRAAST